MIRITILLLLTSSFFACKKKAGSSSQVKESGEVTSICCVCEQDFFKHPVGSVFDPRTYLRSDVKVATRSFISAKPPDLTCSDFFNNQRVENQLPEAIRDFDYGVKRDCRADGIKGSTCTFGSEGTENRETVSNETISAPVNTPQLFQSEVDKLNRCPLSPAGDTCTFYLCLENSKMCGNAGYPVSYGLKYCQNFLGQCGGQLTSGLANQWIKGTMKCLQSQLIPSKVEKLSCTSLKTEAFNSHPYCYTYGSAEFGGLSMCLLDEIEFSKIGTCVDIGDILTVASAQQVATAATICADIYAGATFDNIATKYPSIRSYFSAGQSLNLTDASASSAPTTNMMETIEKMTPEEKLRRKAMFDKMQVDYMAWSESNKDRVTEYAKQKTPTPEEEAAWAKETATPEKLDAWDKWLKRMWDENESWYAANEAEIKRKFN